MAKETWEEFLAKSDREERKQEERQKKLKIRLGEENPQGAVEPDIESKKQIQFWNQIRREFSALAPEFQQGVIGDIKKQKRAGASLEETLVRTKEVISKSLELMDLSATDSDKFYRPKKTAEESKLEKELGEGVGNNLEELLEMLERMRYKGDEDEANVDPGPQNRVM